jgi:hypothetical protein
MLFILPLNRLGLLSCAESVGVASWSIVGVDDRVRRLAGGAMEALAAIWILGSVKTGSVPRSSV